MDKIKKVLKKISKFFGWIVAGLGLTALIIMKFMSKNNSEIDLKITEKKDEIKTKKEELKATEEELHNQGEALDNKIKDSKNLNNQISSDKEIRDKQADKFFKE